jgi:hypothetical protein
MDDNLRQVLIAAITVAGPLSGIWLGTWLEGRRRHDADKRNAYLDLLALYDFAVFEDDNISEEARLAMLRAVNQTRLLGSRAVDAAAVQLRDETTALVRVPRSERDERVATKARWDAARRAFRQAARKDLGVRD